MSSPRGKSKVEFGDFQTPPWLAKKVCSTLLDDGICPKAILEPTCGQGNFLISALEVFRTVSHAIGLDINASYIEQAKTQLSEVNSAARVQVLRGNFFSTDWQSLLSELPDPLLVLGNPPWVTNSELASLNSNNVPPKSNFQRLSGIDAITGASNFDISEWMLIKMLEWINDRSGAIAMLCKTAVARKVLLYSWKNGFSQADCRIYRIDTQKAFDTSVEACLLLYDNIRNHGNQTCYVYDNVSSRIPSAHIGFRDGQLVADVEAYELWSHLQVSDSTISPYEWRSGIKHDCSKVMELQSIKDGFVNKLGEVWKLEEEYLYPMYKGSEIAGKLSEVPQRWMLVTQRNVGDSTASIRLTAPITWKYLNEHSNVLDRRKSSIYRNRPRFSIFGVGDYSFAPWKVAISGMYKKLGFVVIGPHGGKPVVLDDTCYFIPCHTQDEANFMAKLLNSDIAKEFYRAFIFWDDKRPITAKVLRRLDLFGLAKQLGYEQQLLGFTRANDANTQTHTYLQPRLLDIRSRYQTINRPTKGTAKATVGSDE